MSNLHMFEPNTYIILEFPEEVAGKILSIRKRYDEFRAALPAEITLTGSSGVGVLSQEQEPEKVYAVLDEIATKTKPIEISLGEVKSFPGTDIYYFSIKDETPIRNLHSELSQSSILFGEMPFPYTPHCTISSRDDLASDEIEEIKNLRINETFTVESLAVLSLYRDENRNLHTPVRHRVKLTGD